MHVLLVTYEFPPAMATGGIGSYMYQLACLLHRMGHQVSVISAVGGEADKVINRDFCTNYLVEADGHEPFRRKALFVFERYFDVNEIDLIESPEVGACALEIKRKYPNIPLLVKIHTPGVLITKISNEYQSIKTKLRYVAGALLRGRFDLGYWNKRGRGKDLDPEYIICQLADHILSPSEALRKWIVGYWQLPEEKIDVLPNPFNADSSLFEFPIDRRTGQICFVGKLTVLKGMYTLAPALKEILQKYQSYRAVLVGRDEPVSEQIPSMRQWMMQQLGNVETRVIFTGPLPPEEVKEVLAQSEVIIAPSLWENYPTVVLEGMAAGCAVAASRRGGIPEIIRHRENGLLFDPTSVRSIVRVLDLLLSDVSFRTGLAEKGRAFMLKCGDDVFIRKTEQIYLSVAKKRA